MDDMNDNVEDDVLIFNTGVGCNEFTTKTAYHMFEYTWNQQELHE